MWRAADSSTDRRTDVFGAQLRTHRVAAGLTQEALAERASLSVRAIQNLERGDRHPYADTTARLVAALALAGAERAAFESAGRTPPRARVVQAAAPHVPATNLPAQLSACIGREGELEAIVGAVDDARLVTLLGPGGSGKTRLALEVGFEQIRRHAPFGDGIWFVELDAVLDPTLVAHAVAAALGVGETRGQTLVETLIGALVSRHVLIVLDNCEHVLSACAALVETLLSRCPHVRVLATSRQALGLPWEVVSQVPPLDLPPVEATFDTLEQYASVRLFLERARSAAPGVHIGPDNAAEVAAVCRQLDGMPLALELAAARLRGLSVHDLAQRLDEPFRLLTAATRPRARQQSLRAAIDWSYDLLDEVQRRLLRHLSVFSGGWTLAAAEAVCGPESADGLAHLVDHSLVQVDWRNSSAPRYRLLETVRQYAAERLAADTDADDASATRCRHLDYYARLAETAEAALEGADQVRWLWQLDAEQANVRAALHVAFERADDQRGPRLAAALGAYWALRGERTEGLAWLELALRLSTHETGALRARVLRAAGRLALATRNEQAAAWLEQSLELSRARDDRSSSVRCLVHLGELWIDTGALDRASAVLEDARALAHSIDDRPGLAAALVTLGQARLDQSDYARSVPLLEEGRDRFRALGNRAGLAQALLELAMARLEMGDAPAAQGPLEEAEDLARAIGDAVGVAWTQHGLARLALDTDRPLQAAELFERSLELFRLLGHGTGVAWSLHNLGRARLALGEQEPAVVLFESGLELFRTLEHARGIGWALYNLAWVAGERGDAEQARHWLVEGMRAFRSVGFDHGASICLVGAARLIVDEAPELAARWLGLAVSLCPGISTQDRLRTEAVASLIRQRLSGERFDAAWQAGAAQAQTVAELGAQLEAAQRTLLAVPA